MPPRLNRRYRSWRSAVNARYGFATRAVHESGAGKHHHHRPGLAWGHTPPENPMTATRDLHSLGQSIWIDNITRPMLDSGTLQHYIDDLDVTGLTSNPTIYDKAIGGSDAYDADV